MTLKALSDFVSRLAAEHNPNMEIKIKIYDYADNSKVIKPSDFPTTWRNNNILGITFYSKEQS